MISPDIEKYAEEHSSPERDLLYRLSRETNLTQVYPRMLSGHLQGLFLSMISRLMRPARILEIGTFTGYSAICLADGLATGGMLHTIEVNPELEDRLRDYLDEAGLSGQITLHIGDALKVIPGLDERWDLVFLDADKPNYLLYYEMILPFMQPGGIILADNALWDGKVLRSRERMDKDTEGISRFNDAVTTDTRVENLLLPIRDGLMMIRKK